LLLKNSILHATFVEIINPKNKFWRLMDEISHTSDGIAVAAERNITNI